MTEPFSWPNGKRAAVSMTFDDARLSQADCAHPILDAYGLKASFYVMTHNAEKRLDGWKRAVANGHEIGNHTLSHPCSGNFRGWRGNALEEYTIERIEAELAGADKAIRDMLGVTPQTFAYPCGQKFVGRGRGVVSYVPLVAKRFLAGRGFCDEAANDPTFCDCAQLYGRDADCRSFDVIRTWIEAALSEGGWLILCSHEVGGAARQTLPAETLEALCRYATDEANGVWMDTVAAVAEIIHRARTPEAP